jgi:homoserine kinase
LSLVVSVPASSANVGPGFDVLGLALSMRAELGTADASDHPGLVDERHPATVAFRAAGGVGGLWVRPGIPMGRGLGFSGAMRVGGVALAHAQQHGSGLAALDERRPEILELAAELEGHADNAAASLYGGVVAVVDGRAVRLTVGFDPTVLVWVPSSATKTAESRQRLAAHVDRGDAVFNLGRLAVLVAGLASGDPDLLRLGTADRLHQPSRLAAQPQSREALEAALTAGAHGAWLSGSGPSVACFCDDESVERITAALPPDGAVKALRLDVAGVTFLGAGSDGR